MFGYGLSGSSYSKTNINGVIIEESGTLDFEAEEENRFDFSINIGAGVSLATGANRLFLDIHYQAGLSNMTTADQSGSTFGEVTDTNNNFIFSVGFLTPITTAKAKP